MKRQLLAWIVVLYASRVPAATAAPAIYDLSGDQFVQLMTHPESLTAQHYRNREKAYSYLDGAKDATVGIIWCPTKPRKTFELAYDAVDYIRALPPQARKGNAAKLMISFLSSRYPCTIPSK